MFAAQRKRIPVRRPSDAASAGVPLGVWANLNPSEVITVLKGVSKMKFPCRLLAVFVSSLLILGACSSARAAQAPQAADSPQGTASSDQSSAGLPNETVIIPGPLRSFLRMAGISQEIAPANDVLPLLARNAFLYGHVGEGRRSTWCWRTAMCNRPGSCSRWWARTA